MFLFVRQLNHFDQMFKLVFSFNIFNSVLGECWTRRKKIFNLKRGRALYIELLRVLQLTGALRKHQGQLLGTTYLVRVLGTTYLVRVLGTSYQVRVLGTTYPVSVLDTTYLVRTNFHFRILYGNIFATK